ncbi:MAG: hypothetical protein IIA40_04170 [SAR324 cluster bacterium]|nr:hypothetical protein [SAR324 cluster bacterium]
MVGLHGGAQFSLRQDPVAMRPVRAYSHTILLVLYAPRNFKVFSGSGSAP